MLASCPSVSQAESVNNLLAFPVNQAALFRLYAPGIRIMRPDSLQREKESAIILAEMGTYLNYHGSLNRYANSEELIPQRDSMDAPGFHGRNRVLYGPSNLTDFHC